MGKQHFSYILSLSAHKSTSLKEEKVRESQTSEFTQESVII